MTTGTASRTTGRSAGGAPTPPKVDTDNDGMGDCVEAWTSTATASCDFVGDTIYFAKASLLPLTNPEGGRDGDFDIDGDGLMADYVGDVIWAAKFGLICGASASRTLTGQGSQQGAVGEGRPWVGWMEACRGLHLAHYEPMVCGARRITSSRSREG